MIPQRYEESIAGLCCTTKVATTRRPEVNRRFVFGDLKIESAGTYGQMVFKGVPGPEKKKWLVESQIKNA